MKIQTRKLFKGAEQFRKKKIVEYAGDTVLDIGCNTGADVDFCQKIGKEAVGIDLNPGLIEKAKRRYPWSFKQSRAEELPYKDGEFKTVMMWDVLEHIANDRNALSEALRVSSGNVLLGVPKEDYFSPPISGVTYRQYIDATHRHYYSRKKIAALINSLGDYKILIEEYCRIRPLLIYHEIGIPKFICKYIDRLFWLLSYKKKNLFMRNLFVIIFK